VGDVQHERLTDTPLLRTRPRLAPAERSAFRHFVDAVLALSDDPGPANLERYLGASRALEESRRSRQTPPPARPRTAGPSSLGSGAMQLWSRDATRGDLP
jgi:hypothetical protein